MINIFLSASFCVRFFSPSFLYSCTCNPEIFYVKLLFLLDIYILTHLQRAGNEAFQSGRYTEAVEHYTSALSSNVESRPFAAICLCNRAAAHQALGQIADAIADCSLAIALDGSYSKVCLKWFLTHFLWTWFVTHYTCFLTILSFFFFYFFKDVNRVH